MPSAPPAAFELAEIAPAAQTALSTLKNLEPEDSVDQPASTVQAAIWDLGSRVDQLRDETAKATAANAGSLDTLRDLQTHWKKVQAALTERSEELGGRGKALESESAQVGSMAGRWQATGEAIRQQNVNAPAETVGLVESVNQAVRSARQRIKARQTTNLGLQNALGALVTRADTGENAVDDALALAVKTLFVRDSPPLWAARAQRPPEVAGRWQAVSADQISDLRAYLSEREERLAIHGGIFLALLILILWMRRGVHGLTGEDPQLKRAAPIFEVPIATALALSFVLKGPVYSDAPVLFRTLLGAILLVPTVIILRRLLDRRHGLIVYSLVVFYAVDQVRAVAVSLPALNRWIFCAEMAAAVGVFFFLRRLGSSPGTARLALGRWMPALTALAIALLAAALAANALGYVRLADLLGRSTLLSSYLAVALYALLRVIEGLSFILLRVRPLNRFRIARLHQEEVQNVVYRVIRGVLVLFWLYFTLGNFQLRTLLAAQLARVLGYQPHLGSIKLSLGQLLSFAAALWISVLLSRLIRFFLNEEVYERVQLSPGLPYAISTILNYAVLLVGFLVALGLLGVDLTKITIVAGAFSVGLGFGLQNIINNFVSGIILLFERPVKVGDVLQIGDAVGEVRRIGIRASIIRTRDGSDLIVPNGNLISNQVTNWTYADRSRAVEIAFNVAAESDPAGVLALLKATVEQQPAAAHRPPPQVYITGITATGLSLVVRAWTTHYEDWIQVRSDLSAALLAALTREKIKLV